MRAFSNTCSDFHLEKTGSYITLWEKTFLFYYLQAFSTEEILKSHIKGHLKINNKELLFLKKESMLNSKIMREK